MTATPLDPPVRLRLRGRARTTQIAILAFGVAAGFLAGTGYTLVVGSLDTFAPALRCASPVER